MRIVVDLDLCQGNAICTAIAPEIFQLRPDGTLAVLNDSPDETQLASVEDAIFGCPVQAIAMTRD